QMHLLPFPTEGVGVQVVAGGTARSMRRAHLLALGCQGKGALDGFRRFDTGLNQQVTHQTGAGGFGFKVGEMMQPHDVLFVLLPTSSTDQIKRRRKLAQGVQQSGVLLWSGLQLYSHRSVHIKNAPSMAGDMQEQQGDHASPGMNAGVPWAPLMDSTLP